MAVERGIEEFIIMQKTITNWSILTDCRNVLPHEVNGGTSKCQGILTRK